VTEAELLQTVRDLCGYLHVRCYHTHRSDRSEPGFPDLTIVGPKGLIFRELKTEAGKLTRAQMAWGHELTEAGADWKVWRPHDLPGMSGEIVRLCGRGTA
jgi:hypothetical protein